MKLIGTQSNRSAIGARASPIWRQTAGAGGDQPVQLLFVNDRRLHFGLGKAETADLEIQWPTGVKQTFSKLAANQLVVIREGSAVVERAPWPGR